MSVKFSDLEVGERFNWDDIRTASPRYNRQYGPFTKISGKRYEDDAKTFQIPVESPTHFVTRVAPRLSHTEAAKP